MGVSVTDEFFEINGHQFRVPGSTSNGHHDSLNGFASTKGYTAQYGSTDSLPPADENRYRGGRRSTNQPPPEQPSPVSSSRHLLPESAPRVDDGLDTYFGLPGETRRADPLNDPLAVDPYSDPFAADSLLNRRPVGAQDPMPPAEDLSSPRSWAAQQAPPVTPPTPPVTPPYTAAPVAGVPGNQQYVGRPPSDGRAPVPPASGRPSNKS